MTLCCAENRRCQSSRVTSPLDFLKVVRLVFWSGVVGPGFRSLALRARSLALRARTIALRAQKLDIAFRDRRGAASLR